MNAESIQRDVLEITRELLQVGASTRWIQMTLDGVQVEVEIAVLNAKNKQTGERQVFNKAQGKYIPDEATIH